MTTHHVDISISLFFNTPFVSSVRIDGIPVLVGQQLTLPKSALMGFSSASGLWTDYHAVSNATFTYRR